MVICIGLSKSALSTYITSKVPKMWYTLMDHYSFDIVANRLQLKTEEDLVALRLWFPIYMTSHLIVILHDVLVRTELVPLL